MRLELLLSCMHQKDNSIAARSAVTTDILIINQCDAEDYEETAANAAGSGNTSDFKIRMISTKERGISRSRNMALKNASGDICLLCDDDEEFLPGYENVITGAFERHPEADVIIFRLEGLPTSLKEKEYRLGKMECLKAASVTIAFRLEKVRKAGITFDVFMGSGSGNGSGEEIKFMMDLSRAGMVIWHVPEKIAVLHQNGSAWFSSYDEKFFYQRGTFTRYIFGLPVSLLYAFFYVIKKKKMYEKDISPAGALENTLKGIMNNDIRRQQLEMQKPAAKKPEMQK